MTYPGWHNGYADADLEELHEGEQDITCPSLTLVGGLPYENTYIVRRQGDQVLTPNGWFDIDEMEDA